MTFLQTMTCRKSMITGYLRPGNGEGGTPSKEMQNKRGERRNEVTAEKSPLRREGFVDANFIELIGRLPRLLHQQIRRNDIPVHIRQLRSNRRGHVFVRAIRLLRDQVHRVVPRGPGVKRQVIRADHTGNRRNRSPKRRRQGNTPKCSRARSLWGIRWHYTTCARIRHKRSFRIRGRKDARNRRRCNARQCAAEYRSGRKVLWRRIRTVAGRQAGMSRLRRSCCCGRGQKRIGECCRRCS